MPSGFYHKITEDMFFETLYGLEVNNVGVVRNKQTKEVLANKVLEGILFVHTNEESPFMRKGDYKSCAVMDLMGHAFKRLNLPEKEFSKCSCLPIDEDDNNAVVNNLIWMLPPDGIETTIPGFKYIPGYTRYAYSLAGEIYSFWANRRIAKFDSHIGKIVRIDSDSGRLQRTIHEDRVLLLTFKPYPRNVDSLVINHKDGDRDNRTLENLEWITQSENLIHSFVRRESGEIPPDFVYIRNKFDPIRAANYLIENEVPFSSVITKWFKEEGCNHLIPDIPVEDDKPVKRLDAKTREVIVYESIDDARFDTFADSGLPVVKSLVLRSIKSRPSKTNRLKGFVSNRYLFRRLEDDFPDFTDAELKMLRKKERRRVVMYDAENHRTSFFDSVFELERETGFTVRVALLRLKKNTQRLPGSNYYIQYEENIGPWKIEPKA